MAKNSTKKGVKQTNQNENTKQKENNIVKEKKSNKKWILCVVILAIAIYLLLSKLGINQVLQDIKQSHQQIDNYDSTYGSKSLNSNLDHDNQDITNLYYNLVTDFYEYGWGSSFHFASRWKGESFEESIKRQEYYMAAKLNLKKGMKVLDMGSGVGGPARNIAKFSDAEIHAVTLNDYQVQRCNYLTPQDLKKIVKCHQGDYTNLEKFQNESFDAVYAFESTVHVEDRSQAFAQAYRVLKKGGLFGNFEWAMTKKYDSQNATHVEIKRGVEHGNGLPNLIADEKILNYMKGAGFEIIEQVDMDIASKALFGEQYVPWYKPLQPEWSIEGFKSTLPGRYLTSTLLFVLENLKAAPEGSQKIAKMLEDGAFNLERGGSLGIFTPLYLIVGRKN